MPRPIIYTLVIGAMILLIPLAIAFKSRQSKTQNPPVHPIQDMDVQPRFDAQAGTLLYALPGSDALGPVMRPPVPGTVARGELWNTLEDSHYYRGVVYRDTPDGEGVASEFAEGLPPQVVDKADAAYFARGRQRYEIYCSPCHSFAGDGVGMVTRWAQSETLLARGVTWPAPANLTSIATTEGMVTRASEAWTRPERLPDPAQVFTMPFYQQRLAALYAEHGVAVGDALESDELAAAMRWLYGEARLDSYAYAVIRNGYGNMGPYGSQIMPEDRWAIVLYLRALRATADPEYRATLAQLGQAAATD